ncbi:hypothetical protein J6590_089065 [Homalodisca vitripennis]|nr:hypothetical protein J6590_089065 [Homalodisca vitripennis]
MDIKNALTARPKPAVNSLRLAVTGASGVDRISSQGIVPVKSWNKCSYAGKTYEKRAKPRETASIPIKTQDTEPFVYKAFIFICENLEKRNTADQLTV